MESLVNGTASLLATVQEGVGSGLERAGEEALVPIIGLGATSVMVLGKNIVPFLEPGPHL